VAAAVIAGSDMGRAAYLHNLLPTLTSDITFVAKAASCFKTVVPITLGVLQHACNTHLRYN